MSKEFSICYFFVPIDIVTLQTIWWLQLHSTYHQPQVSSIYFMRFLWYSLTYLFSASVTRTVAGYRLRHPTVIVMPITCWLMHCAIRFPNGIKLDFASQYFSTYLGWVKFCLWHKWVKKIKFTSNQSWSLVMTTLSPLFPNLFLILSLSFLL